MTTTRLEAFSDGVRAIIITIMVLEMHVHEGSTWAAIRPVIDVLTSYALSFACAGSTGAPPPFDADSPASDGAVLLATCISCSGCRSSRSSPLGGKNRVCLSAGRGVRRGAAVRCLAFTYSCERSCASPVGFETGTRDRYRFQGKISVVCTCSDTIGVHRPAGRVSRYTSRFAITWLVPDRRSRTGSRTTFVNTALSGRWLGCCRCAHVPQRALTRNLGSRCSFRHLRPTCARARAHTVRAAAHVDGDSITCRDIGAVRLIGVDSGGGTGAVRGPMPRRPSLRSPAR